MGAVNLAAVTAVITKKFDDEISSQINRSTPLLRFLRVRQAKSDYVKWVATFGTAAPTTAKITDGADVTEFNADTKVAAGLAMGTYHDAFSISGKALAAAWASGNPANLTDLFRNEIRDSVPRLSMALANAFYTGDGSSDAIMGITATNGAFKATGTYAGVNRSTYPQFAGNELLNGGVARALSIPLMRQMRRTVYTARGWKPDLIICDPIQHEKYGELCGEPRRYVQEVVVRGQKIVLDAGYSVLDFDGIPVVEDVSAPAGCQLWFNTSVCGVDWLPHPTDVITRSMGEMELRGTEEEQFGESSMPIRARIQPLAVTGDLFKFALYVYPQFWCKYPSACGILGDLLS